MKFPRWDKKQVLQVVSIVFALGVMYVGYIYFSTELPDTEDLANLNVPESTRLYDRKGEVLFYEIYRDEKRTVVPADQISDIIRKATLSIEDDSFYQHGAFDWRGLVRALFVNLVQGRVVQGGSTITQQLAKNTFLTAERTVTRKLREAVLAIKLEQKYSKDEILDLYLNQVPYGPTIYGVESAAIAYFDKSAKDVDINEAATLAALPKAPSYYSPWGSHRDVLRDRKNYIVSRMLELGYIDEDQARNVPEDLPEIQAQSENGIRAPHFAITIQEYLRDKYGEDTLRTGGLKVITTLDWEMQEIAEDAVETIVARNQEIADGNNGALLAMDPQTGQVLAMVGSRDYFADPEPEGCSEGVDCVFEGNFNVALQGLRQPGSSFKPFAYLTAFQNGLTPNTILWDVKTEFSLACPPECYSPNNFDGRFRGPITMAEGLAQSLNVPAVKTLYLAGLERTMDNAALFGITTFDDPARFGLSLVLGGGEVKMVELLGAYGVLATEGIYNKPTFILKVEDRKGKVLEEYKNEGKRVIDPQYPRLINKILSDANLRAPIFSAVAGITQVPGYQVAIKTGTTDDFVDAWTFGYTPNLAVGVWAGNNNRAPLGGSSLQAAIPMWYSFMSRALPKLPVQYFNPPDAAIGASPVLNGELIEGEYHSILHYIGRQNDPQYPNWEAAIRAWLSNNPEPTRFPTSEPDEGESSSDDDLDIEFVAPENGDRVNQAFILRARISGDNNIVSAKVYLDGAIVADYSGSFGERLSIREELLGLGSLQSVVRIETRDEDGNMSSEEIIIFF